MVPVENVGRYIFSVRGQRVMLDSDLARLYGVEVKRLNEQVRRNPDRFPPEFMFQLTSGEFSRLRSQIATSKGRGGRRYLPYAFTEHGAVMLATVLNSSARAVQGADGFPHGPEAVAESPNRTEKTPWPSSTSPGS